MPVHILKDVHTTERRGKSKTTEMPLWSFQHWWGFTVEKTITRKYSVAVFVNVTTKVDAHYKPTDIMKLRYHHTVASFHGHLLIMIIIVEL